jgi:hypothetical protein
MPDILSDFAPAALTAAVEANFAAFFAYLGRAPQAVAHEDAATAWCISGIPIAEYTAVTRFQMPDGAAPAFRLRAAPPGYALVGRPLRAPDRPG